MKIRYEFLTSKLGRRIFGLFICCSLIPIAALSALSFGQVMKDLKQQSERRLQQSTKSVGMSILERLLLLNTAMRSAEMHIKSGSQAAVALQEQVEDELIAKRFAGIVVVRNNDGVSPLVGVVHDVPKLTSQERAGLVEGKTGLITRSDSSTRPRIFLVRLLDPAAHGSDLLVGEVNTNRLWTIGPDNALPPMTDLCVMDKSNNIIISSIPAPDELIAALLTITQQRGARLIEWKNRDGEFLAGHWSIFLKAKFASDNWTVILSQSKRDIFAPISDFKVIFTLVTLMSVLLVAFLSMYFIRQTLQPLEAVREGIQKISRRDFDTRISVTSGDEFEEVAATFNEMSEHLGRQFKALTTMAEIDRAILSSLDTERIVTTALTGMRGFFSCDTISILLLDLQRTNTGMSYTASGDLLQANHARAITFRPGELQRLLDNPEHLLIQEENDFPGYLTASSPERMRCCLILPVFVKKKLVGTINMGYVKTEAPSYDDVVHARQLADQMAVALSNSSLVEELDQLNWGTLKALARTVDAKSPWTAGHSERVTALALEIARHLGLSQEAQDHLHRGAFLHDVGKVGIPNRILDKPGPLDLEEYEVIKEHPRMGALILEPIAAYQQVIPIVLQHHERYDGKGYPDGLKAEAICLGARILTAADVFDAMLATRPYRDGINLADVIDYMKNGARRHFDPHVVEALLYVIERDGQVAEMLNGKVLDEAVA
jgi:putative nucleotidyltransferase with HDIG domain